MNLCSSTKHMRIKTFFRILIIIVAVVAVAFLIFWIRPKAVVQSAFNKLANSDTQSFGAIVSISNPQAAMDILGEKSSIELDVKGKFKREKTGRDSIDAVVKLTTNSESITMLTEVNIKFVGEQSYFQVVKAPPTFPALVQLKGEWIEIARGTQRDVSELPIAGEIFLEVKSGDKREVNGDNTKVYQAKATSAAVIHMLDNIASILGTHLSTEQIKGIQEGIASAESMPVELAITPWSREIRQIKSSTVVPDSNNTMSIEFTFADRNEVVEIEAPSNAQTLGSMAGVGTDSISQ